MAPVAPSGRKGENLSAVAAGTASTMNAVRARTLMTTSTAFTVALSLVPITSNQVTASAMITAGKLMMPPAYGPVTSAAGNSMPAKLFSTPTM